MKKVETIKGTQSTPIRPSLTNPKKMSYDDVSYTESDFYLYWQQSSFSHIDKSQQNNASSSNRFVKEFSNGITPPS